MRGLFHAITGEDEAGNRLHKFETVSDRVQITY
jgi:hypothetical protein